MKDSFSEDLEDVICWRLVDETTPATYLDIGANHPVESSVTYLFYRRGWRGVAVDPLPQFARLWADHRAEDVLLTAAIGAADSSADVMDFFEYDPSVLSTGDPDRHQQLLSDPAARHLATHAVPLMTAAQVIEAYPEMYRGGGRHSFRGCRGRRVRRPPGIGPRNRQAGGRLRRDQRSHQIWRSVSHAQFSLARGTRLRAEGCREQQLRVR